ncbi:unnamed protein product (mitochondrion) [Plasmodiophora brassicae]|uniref:Uncharacterized protein n=1 Tax=Plasmodiophora brassicae TaxID=37360 RepID=A0A3P3Y3B4_PLABS|nr:unnamed protein product [Plasmodiophora brassicae]
MKTRQRTRQARLPFILSRDTEVIRPIMSLHVRGLRQRRQRSAPTPIEIPQPAEEVAEPSPNTRRQRRTSRPLSSMSTSRLVPGPQPRRLPPSPGSQPGKDTAICCRTREGHRLSAKGRSPRNKAVVDDLWFALVASPSDQCLSADKCRALSVALMKLLNGWPAAVHVVRHSLFAISLGGDARLRRHTLRAILQRLHRVIVDTDDLTLEQFLESIVPRLTFMLSPVASLPPGGGRQAPIRLRWNDIWEPSISSFGATSSMRRSGSERSTAIDIRPPAAGRPSSSATTRLFRLQRAMSCSGLVAS